MFHKGRRQRRSWLRLYNRMEVSNHFQLSAFFYFIVTYKGRATQNLQQRQELEAIAQIFVKVIDCRARLEYRVNIGSVHRMKGTMTKTRKFLKSPVPASSPKVRWQENFVQSAYFKMEHTVNYIDHIYMCRIWLL